jgi:glycosyltransferase involved in cell wall biosynthesis
VHTVVIFQYRLLHYRTELFDTLQAECQARGIALQLVHGQASARERAKSDEGKLTWAHVVRNRFFKMGERDLVWQPFPGELKNADLVVVMQENRILSNYPLLLTRLWSKRKVAYWGHGRNFQSEAPEGIRERWKNFLLTRVDWWFAYTQLSAEIVERAGFPSRKITCLNNAIDNSSFQNDLASWTDQQIEAERCKFGHGSDASINLFCGSLYVDKRLDLLIEAADLIKKAMPAFVLVVIGDGPAMPYMRAAAESRPWLHLLGVRRGREKAMYFRMADLVLNPGTVGLHILDSFCSGTILVTTQSARHSPEIAYLQNGVNAICTDDTATAFSQAVVNITRDPARLLKMQANARADGDRYTLSNMVDRFVSGIQAALHD